VLKKFDNGMKSMQDDVNASTRELMNVKNDVEDTIKQAAEGSEAARSEQKEAKNGALLTTMVADLEELMVDVDNALDSEDGVDDPEALRQLEKDIQEALVSVKSDVKSDESLKLVSRLSMHMQSVLLKDEQEPAAPLGWRKTEDEEDDDEEENEQPDEEGGPPPPQEDASTPLVNRSPQKGRRKTSLHTLPSFTRGRSESIANKNNENNLRDRMEGTGKRLADLMSAFSNVGKLELSVRQLQDQMQATAKISKVLTTTTSTINNTVVSKADKVEMDSFLSKKADLAMVQEIVAELRSQNEKLLARTTPANMAKSLASENMSNNAIDELSANVQNTVMNFEKMKKDLSNKASAGDVANAIGNIQSSMKTFINDTFDKDELMSTLEDKVDKRELKKLADALSGMDGPASLSAGATKCLICDRPGIVHTKELVNAQMSGVTYDPLDGPGSVSPQSSLAYGELAPVRAPGSRGNSWGGGSVEGAGSAKGDNIDRYREEELVGSVSVTKHPRIMPPANRMRVAAGGGMRVSSGGRGGGRR